MTDEKPAEKKRSQHVYVLWGMALALLLTTSLFSWFFVRPYLMIRTMTAEYSVAVNKQAQRWYPASLGMEELRRFSEPRVARLGGAERAAGRLAFYLRLPPSWTSNRSAAVALCYFCGPPGVPVLARALRDEDPAVRLVAAGGLSLVGPQAKEAMPELIAALRDNKRMIRWLAADALGKIGPPAGETVPAMLAALPNNDWPERFAIIAAVSRITDPENYFTPEDLLSQFDDSNPRISDRSRRLLEALTKDKDPKIRRAAAEALKKMGSGLK